MKLLHVDSSILGDHSVSRSLSREVVERLRDEASLVTYRDLAADPLAHYSGPLLQALQDQEGDHGEDVQADVRASGAALQEFVEADLLVIGVPLYNFGIPSQLKAWVDRLMVAKVTFQYRQDGTVEGLMRGKRAILCMARGGFYQAGSPQADFEHAETYLQAVLQFLGVTDVTVIAADGLAAGPDHRAAALTAARGQIEQLQKAS